MFSKIKFQINPQIKLISLIGCWLICFLLVLAGCSLRGTRHISEEYSVSDVPQQYFLCFHLEQKSAVIGGSGYLLKYDGQGAVEVISRFPCSYGENGWRKKREGDRKTPTGRYQITHINNKGDSKRYGPYSLVINYPTRWDRQERRTGSDLAIHGGRVSMTYGCIRILDGTFSKPQFGKHNISEVKQHCSPGTQVFLSPRISRDLIGKPGQRLSPNASRHWAYLLLPEHSNEAVLKEIR